MSNFTFEEAGNDSQLPKDLGENVTGMLGGNQNEPNLSILLDQQCVLTPEVSCRWCRQSVSLRFMLETQITWRPSAGQPGAEYCS